MMNSRPPGIRKKLAQLSHVWHLANVGTRAIQSMASRAVQHIVTSDMRHSRHRFSPRARSSRAGLWRTMSTDVWVKLETFAFPAALFVFLWLQIATLQKYMIEEPKK